MKSFKKGVLYISLLLAAIGCNPDNDVITSTESKLTPTEKLYMKVNSFAYDNMQSYYLWTDFLPSKENSKTSPFDYFETLKYKKYDRWSWITDDYEALIKGFDGIEKSMGYSLQLYWRDASQTEIVAVIKIVYPNTPAAEAGLKRGDVITKINNAPLVESNYQDLLGLDVATVTYGTRYKDNNGASQIADKGTVSLTSREITVFPILYPQVKDTLGHKIGYFMFDQFSASYNHQLDTTFAMFNRAGITDLILDLRYNPGGYGSVANFMASSIAPTSVAKGKKLLVTFKYNTELAQYFSLNGMKDRLEEYFTDTVQNNMNLQTLYVLTTSGTASASELLICGLQPYMNVVLVGDTTHGKYTGSVTLQPEVYKNNQWVLDEAIKNWAIQPIIMKYANALGKTEFINGFAPDIYVDDYLYAPIGSAQDPMYAAAFKAITGSNPLGAKSARMGQQEQSIGSISGKAPILSDGLLVVDKFKRH